MKRKFDIGDRVICSETEVIGKVIRFYTPTACAEQTLVLTDDGRQYHAPTRTWAKYKDGLDTRVVVCDEFAWIRANPYINLIGNLMVKVEHVSDEAKTYAIRLAATRPIDISQALYQEDIKKLIYNGLGIDVERMYRRK